VQTRIPGARLFGSLDFAPIPGMPFPAGCAPSCGLRNSADKSFALSILSGTRVIVCANGVLSGEFVITRKHTSGLDLVESIDAALDAFMESLRGFNQTYEQLRARRLKPLKKNESLRKRVTFDLNQIKNDKQLVQAFFCAPSVAYTTD